MNSLKASETAEALAFAVSAVAIFIRSNFTGPPIALTGTLFQCEDATEQSVRNACLKVPPLSSPLTLKWLELSGEVPAPSVAAPAYLVAALIVLKKLVTVQVPQAHLWLARAAMVRGRGGGGSVLTS